MEQEGGGEGGGLTTDQGRRESHAKHSMLSVATDDHFVKTVVPSWSQHFKVPLKYKCTTDSVVIDVRQFVRLKDICMENAPPLSWK